MTNENMNKFKEIYQKMLPNFSGELILNEPLFMYTTLRVGGEASLYARADTVSDLKQLMLTCNESGFDYFIIGRGANLLISDEGFDGIVIHLGSGFNLIKVNINESQITAGGAVSLARLMQEAYANSLEGLAFAAGIPATVGGAIASNAGAFGHNICDLVARLSVLSNGKLKNYHAPLKAFYRKGPLLKGEVVVEAIFQLKPGEKMTIKAKSEALFKKRKLSQPLNFPNAGSVFKNPDDQTSAGQLIEQSGLKGVSVGDAFVSDIHANFIVNRGKAKAADVYKLLKLIRQKVKQIHGIKLEPEIKLIGNFSE